MLFNLPPFSCEISSTLINHSEVSLLSDCCLNHTNTQLLLPKRPNYHTCIDTNFWNTIHSHACFIGLSYHMFHQFVIITYKHAHNPATSDIVRVCVWAHTWAQALEWVAVELKWKAWGPVTERTEGSSIIIKNDFSAPYCGLTASSSQAVRLFVRLLCQCGWSVFLNQCTLQLLLPDGGRRHK